MQTRPWLLGVVLSVFAVPAFALTVFLEPAQTSTGDVDANTLNQLFRSALAEQGHPPASRETAEVRLRPGLVKLGNAYIVSAEKEQGGKTTATQLKAKSVEELDDVVNRVARAALEGNRALASARPSDVTAVERDRGNTRKASRSGGNFYVGPAWAGSLGVQGTGFALGGGSSWAMGDFYIGFGGDLAYFPNGPRPYGAYLDGKLEALYYFLDEDISPFLGGEFGWALLRDVKSDDWFGGFHLGAQAGVGILRTYDMHVRVGLRGSLALNGALQGTPKVAVLFVGVTF